MSLDPKILFYLRHRHLIDEWCALRKRLHQEAHRYLLTLANDLEEAVASLGPDVIFRAVSEGSWPGARVYRQSWIDPAYDVCPAAVVFQWHTADVTFDTTYVGACVALNSHPAAAQYNQQIHDRATSSGIVGPHTKRSQWWPVYWYIKPAREDFWEDMAGFRQQLIDEILEAWRLLSPIIDSVVSEIQEEEHPAPPPSPPRSGQPPNFGSRG